MQLLLYAVDVVLQALQLAVPNFGHSPVVAFPLSLLRFKLEALHLLLVLLNLVHQSLFALPLSAVGVLLILQLGYLLIQLGNLVGVVLTLNGLALNLQLLEVTCNLIQLLRHRVAFHAQLSGSLVHQVDGLIGQEAVGYVALRQFHGSDTCIIGDTHLVMVLVTLLQATQNADGIYLIWLVHHDGLEAALKRFILFKVLLILVQRGGTNGSELSSCQCRLQNVGCVHGALATSGSHKGVNLIYKEDYLAVGLRYFLDDRLESLLKLALVFGSGHQCAHVK